MNHRRAHCAAAGGGGCGKRASWQGSRTDGHRPPHDGATNL